jgi:transcriptional regulator with XRE-family HTH domain
MPLEPEEVGRRIREARLAHGWTHEELAHRMGVNWRTAHRWQTGQLPRLGTLLRLADTLGVPRSFLVDTEESAVLLENLQVRLDELATRLDALSQRLEAVAEAVVDGTAPPAATRRQRASRPKS